MMMNMDQIMMNMESMNMMMGNMNNINQPIKKEITDMWNKKIIWEWYGINNKK